MTGNTTPSPPSLHSVLAPTRSNLGLRGRRGGLGTETRQGRPSRQVPRTLGSSPGLANPSRCSLDVLIQGTLPGRRTQPPVSLVPSSGSVLRNRTRTSDLILDHRRRSDSRRKTFRSRGTRQISTQARPGGVVSRSSGGRTSLPRESFHFCGVSNDISPKERIKRECRLFLLPSNVSTHPVLSSLLAHSCSPTSLSPVPSTLRRPHGLPRLSLRRDKTGTQTRGLDIGHDSRRGAESSRKTGVGT